MQPGVPMQPQQPSNAGKGLATASMVFGIIGIVFWFFNLASIVSVFAGIIGIPFMFLSFICLAALPALAITDHGFVNVMTLQVEDPIKEVVE